MGISYKLESFEGPLDLLLHLIEKNKVNIYDIPIATITDQYLEYVKHMEEESMDVVQCQRNRHPIWGMCYQLCCR